MEVASLVISVSGLITIAEKCLEAARLLNNLSSVPSELTSHHAMFQFETLLFTLWTEEVFGRDLTPAAAAAAAAAATTPPPSSPFAIDSQIEPALADVLRITTAVNSIFAGYKMDGKKNPGAPQSPPKLGFRQKARFMVNLHKDSVESTLTAYLERFRYWNTALRSLLTARQQDTFSAGLMYRVLGRRPTAGALGCIKDAADRAEYSAIGAAAEFQMQRLVILDKPVDGRVDSELKHELRLSEFAKPRPPGSRKAANRVVSELSHPPNARLLREYNFPPNTRLLLEYNLLAHPFDGSTLPILLSRLETLSQILSIKNKPPQLRCLDCVGYVSVQDPRPSLALVYCLPEGCSTAPTSLHAAFSLREKERPTFAQRIRLAQELARGLATFHGFGWLHKAFSSKNIIFFHHKGPAAPLDFSKPFISGYEYARPDDPEQVTVSCRDDDDDGSELALDCHPDVADLDDRPRFRRQYDIYGFGLVLLEICMWKPVRSILKEGYLSDREKAAKAVPRGRDLERRWIKVCKDSVAHRMGATYRDAISTCLKWEANDGQPKGGEDAELNSFVLEVVKRLDRCHCTGF